MKAINQIIVALDNMDKKEIYDLLDSCNSFSFIKIGLEQFYKYGSEFPKDLVAKYNKKLFLDLKLHDIPNTVGKAIRSLSTLPIQFLTIHLSGGREMITAAIKEAQNSLPNTQLLGVTHLTSLGEKDFQDLWNYDAKSIEQSFIRLFKLAEETKIHGIVLSAKDLDLFNKHISNSNLVKVCPGIRFQDEIDSGKIQDQKRIESPQTALSKGASYLVMGRSITKASNLAQRVSELENMII